jgi:hypothetical protein
MNGRQTSVLAAAVVLAALVLTAFLGQRTSAQKPDQPAAPGRYQAIPGNDKDPYIVVLDTQTGHCWSTLAGNETNIGWIDLGSPAEKK